MLVLTAERTVGWDVVIVLGEENVKQIKQYDPVEVKWSQCPEKISRSKPAAIGVAYATARATLRHANVTAAR
jgi:hypothetical protein